MPVVKLTTSQKLERGDQENLALELTNIIARELNKPASVTQAIVSDDTVVSFGGNFIAPSAFIAVMSIGGLNRDSCTRLSAAFCELLAKYGISSQRVYICFNDKKAEDFGWNSTVFG
ncbi:MAG: hypothetical protein J5858_03325 [Lentisphaeria bacterium]|nr:hypothetical protein [Lentisphaeria bacterium]